MEKIGLVRFSVNGEINFTSPEFCEICDLRNDEITQNGFFIGLHPKERIDISLKWEELVHSKKSFNLPLNFYRLNGDVVKTKLQCEYHSDLNEYIGILSSRKDSNKDVVDVKDTVFIQTAKLASIGKITAGVGHEINNPLAIIQGYLEIMRYFLEDGNWEEKVFNDALNKQEEAIERISDIANGLRIYARKEATVFGTFDVVDCIDESMKLIRNIFLKQNISIDFIKEAKKEKIFLYGNKGKFRQILMNLFTNAKDAIGADKDGSIEIILRSKDDDLVELEVRDTGSGIPKEKLGKIFDTFYTTKPEGKGTGIGMSIVSSFVSEMNGKITVDSEVGVGTSFKIVFPEQEEVTEVQKLSETRKPIIGKIEGKALIVDDEEGIRKTLAFYLEDMGLTVDIAHDGREGLEKLKKNQYDFVVTDLQMPHLGGEKLIEESKKFQTKETRFVVITGGIAPPKIAEEMDKGKINLDVIQKPFTKKDVFKKLSHTKK